MKWDQVRQVGHGISTALPIQSDGKIILSFHSNPFHILHDAILFQVPWSHASSMRGR